MLNLYYKPTCPFCQRVLKANEVIEAELILLDVSADMSLREELIAKGGKKQVPFLEDTDRGEMLYESNDIITYLSKNYGDGDMAKDSTAPNVCPIE
ncbi:MAG: glutathione S-transferase N-terminal domain-containing protein [Candidatus Paceibacteria bacterium]